MLKTNRIWITSLISLAILGIGGMFIGGYSPFGGLDPAARLQQAPLLLDVPVIRQSLSTSCGEAAIAIAYNYAYPETPISEAEAIAFATDQGYFTPGAPPFTSPENMLKIAQHYADQVSSGRVQTPEQGLDLLAEKLDKGTPVIIDVLSDLTDPESEAHFVVVTGLSLDPSLEEGVIVHYNDPLTGIRDTALWAGSTGVWNAWQNNGDPGGPGWWLAIPSQDS